MDDLPLLELFATANEVRVPGDLERSSPHENVPDTVVDWYMVDGGRILVTFWCSRLHEVVYQTPAVTEQDALRRNDRLFAHYAQGWSWNEVLDNGFGKTYRRTDLRGYALWSYAMDFMTFGTMEFHRTKW